jgi:hypothetical protein
MRSRCCLCECVCEVCVSVLLIVARQRLGKTHPIVARQLLYRNPPIVVRQLLGRSYEITLLSVSP